ncbi:hypothetical protein CGH49_21625 [Vibrio parahaemolyticus]|nr:hypothetical protein CGH49_21625 [Vibrio parahaemolyticus]
MFTAQCFRSGGLRCSPLNAALCNFMISQFQNYIISIIKFSSLFYMRSNQRHIIYPKIFTKD